MCFGKTEAEKRECSGYTFCCAYRLLKKEGYSEKGGHKERSKENDPKHEKHWKKEKKKK